MGNKNSGRRSYVEEFKTKKISQLSHDVLIRILDSPDDVIPLADKLKASLPIVLKTMPEQIEIDDVNALTHDEKLQIIESIRLLTRQPLVIDANS